ncbi:hypothetical protein NL676_008166 [Syzygium grande]|nr:hypothetical protein NL676_008166 [Syzygium grande]
MEKKEEFNFPEWWRVWNHGNLRRAAEVDGETVLVGSSSSALFLRKNRTRHDGLSLKSFIPGLVGCIFKSRGTLKRFIVKTGSGFALRAKRW